MITKGDLIKWLKKIGSQLERNITLIAVGGTAMTLLNLKESTIDVDFDVSKKDHSAFKRSIKLVKGKFRVDVFLDGYIFSEQLPLDYRDIANELKDTKFKNLSLKTLNPVDIIITKVARYNARDEEDISLLLKNFKISRKEVEERFEKTIGSYAGSEDNFRNNFNFILKKHFPE